MANGKPFIIYNWHEWRVDNYSLFQRDINGEWKTIRYLHLTRMASEFVTSTR